MRDQCLDRTESNREIGEDKLRELPTLVHAYPERLYIYIRQGLHYRPRVSSFARNQTLQEPTWFPDRPSEERNPKTKLRGNQQQQETAKPLVLSGYDIHPEAQSTPTPTLLRLGESLKRSSFVRERQRQLHGRPVSIWSFRNCRALTMVIQYTKGERRTPAGDP